MPKITCKLIRNAYITYYIQTKQKVAKGVISLLITIGTVLLTVGAYGLLEKFLYGQKQEGGRTWKETDVIPDAVEIE